MSKQLPPRPNLDHLREQAKSLLSEFRQGVPEASARFVEHLPGLKQNAVALHDAQSVVAREYGFPSWAKLIAHVEEVRAREGITPEIEAQFVAAAIDDMPDRVRRLIELYPSLPRFSAACALVSAEVDLVRHVDPGQTLGPGGMTPIEYVAYSRIHAVCPDRYAAQLECARDLLDRGADPNTYLRYRGEAKIPVLYGAAAESQHIDIVRLLLERGAEPNDGESIYHSAEKGRTDILELLGEHGAEFGPPSSHLCFLFYYREYYESAPANLRGATWLLEHGADPNVRCGDTSETPLHSACRYTNESTLIGLLLDHGADPAARDKFGNTPYQVAFASGNQAALRLLESRGIRQEPSRDHQFLAACASNDVPLIRKAVAEEPEIATRLSSEGDDLMRQFAETGRADGLRGLIAAGFRLDGKDGFTPLHFAALRGQTDAAKVLIASGAPLDIRDGEHHAAPIGWACFGSVHHRSPSSDHAGVVRQLIKAGSSVEDALEQMTNPDHSPDIVEAIRSSLPPS
ncbi:ankyrin repeat domain-containing protein [Fimbriimonas ginsengisoli]|uniref:Ankyrin n=1 Tax=Fimbriimonas ginsengisoli Gsoil 348 TaxID=661478 RepID=A0A068NW28_FIMGI|nr:ankyrin repeat domain-containing protein [Fimbriimonas ginsengisoli]AIE87733.1 ankyrin [Fimbriimonas ginsengisoli Gsoil 348]